MSIFSFLEIVEISSTISTLNSLFKSVQNHFKHSNNAKNVIGEYLGYGFKDEDKNLRTKPQSRAKITHIKKNEFEIEVTDYPKTGMYCWRGKFILDTTKSGKLLWSYQIYQGRKDMHIYGEKTIQINEKDNAVFVYLIDNSGKYKKEVFRKKQ
jgi:hypothetical protein